MMLPLRSNALLFVGKEDYPTFKPRCTVVCIDLMMDVQLVKRCCFSNGMTLLKPTDSMEEVLSLESKEAQQVFHLPPKTDVLVCCLFPDHRQS